MKIEEILNTVIQGDCLKIMGDFPDQSVDLVLTDPPYGLTSNYWDTFPDIRTWWNEVRRISKGPIIMTASQPFSSQIVMSNLENFRHEWIWHKNAGSNFANTVREPMKEHEHILVFSKSKWTYNKQMEERAKSGQDRIKTAVKFESASDNYGAFERVETKVMPNLRVPSSVQKFNRERGKHPTQKPTKLMGYLIKTYSNEGDIILDPFSGSGTTCVAAKQLGRRYCGIEISPEYIKIAEQRLLQDILL